MRVFRVVKRFNIFRGGERGVTLIETLMALAILGIITIGVFSGLSVASKSTFTADQQNTAQSLAQSQMEYIKHSAYIDFSGPEPGEYGLIETPEGYTVEVAAIPIDSDTGQALPAGQDLGLQEITVTVEHYGEVVCTLEAYKGER